MDELELMEAEQKILIKQTAIGQARLEIGRKLKQVKAHQVDIDRYEVELASLKAEVESMRTMNG